MPKKRYFKIDMNAINKLYIDFELYSSNLDDTEELPF